MIRAKQLFQYVLNSVTAFLHKNLGPDVHFAHEAEGSRPVSVHRPASEHFWR